jgi:succinate dehydrogenase hydrophobic anchor subunit
MESVLLEQSAKESRPVFSGLLVRTGELSARKQNVPRLSGELGGREWLAHRASAVAVAPLLIWHKACHTSGRYFCSASPARILNAAQSQGLRYA